MGTLAGWAYRKAITINHTADGAQTNYQMKLSVFKGVSGTYANTGGTITTVGANTIHTFTANDNFYAGKTGIVKVECWGAGGGGAYVSGSGGGGGGGGAYAATPDVAVTAITSYAVVRGTGGARDTAGVAASSTFAATTVVALGGTGVSGTTGGAGGAGASGTGTTKNSGGAGKDSHTTGDVGGGGGGAGGPDGNGVDGTAAVANVGGAGGAGDNGSGGAGGGSDLGENGADNAKGGGGGSGNGSDAGTGGNGGLPGGGGAGTDNSGAGATGGNGQVVITCVTADFLTADYAGVTYLENHCLNWPTDILFTLSDGTTTVGADFWREESDATDGTWWLEANSIPAHPDDWHGYVYYGKIDANDGSNGPNTFIFHDHFDGDLSKWTGDTTKFTCSSSILVGNTAGGAWYAISGKTVNGQATFAWRGNFKYNMSGSNSQTFFGAQVSGQGGAYFYGVNSVVREIGADDSGGGAPTASNWTHNSFLTRDIKVVANTNSRFFESDVERSASPYTTKKPNSALIPCWLDYYSNSGNPFFCDWCLLRNYTANEPTWAASGAEEALGSIIRSVPRMMRIMLMSP